MRPPAPFCHPRDRAPDAAGRWHTYRPDGTEILVLGPSAHDAELAHAG